MCTCVFKNRCSYLVKISTQPPRLQNHSSHRPTNHPSSEVSGWENQQKNRETQRGINITELLWLKLLVTASRNEIETIQTKKKLSFCCCSVLQGSAHGFVKMSMPSCSLKIQITSQLFRGTNTTIVNNIFRHEVTSTD